MSERDEPDLDQVRDALREHDQRSEENAAVEERAARDSERDEASDDEQAGGDERDEASDDEQTDRDDERADDRDD